MRANFHHDWKIRSGVKYVMREKKKTNGKKKNDSPMFIQSREQKS